MKGAGQIIGRIFDIKRFAIHDGPGVRTTVFFKGCSLDCTWCHNPESKSDDRQVSFLPDRCIGCGYCFRACPEKAHMLDEERHVLDRKKCVVCGTCCEECYSGALELVGRDVSVAEVMEELEKDRAFYENSGGGVTLSGGEPMAQFDFAKALLGRARDRGLHTALDTCGFAPRDKFEEIRPFVDLFLYDIKETDSERHRQITGKPNELVLENLRALGSAGARIIVRVPVIPGLNLRDGCLGEVAALLSKLENIEAVEVVAYHRLGLSKYVRLGMECRDPCADIPAASDAEVESWADELRSAGLNTI